jgi:hypothetical protein
MAKKKQNIDELVEAYLKEKPKTSILNKVVNFLIGSAILFWIITGMVAITKLCLMFWVSL